VVIGLILLVGRWVPYLDLLLYGFAASFLGPLAAVFLGFLNTLSSPAAASDRSEPEEPHGPDGTAPNSQDGIPVITGDRHSVFTNPSYNGESARLLLNLTG
jgi:hypothetical protein